eukprot:c16093_g1_i2.p1 GENE.c16093_g1_i2~~c16093_g1_i2.p1  ORF type:complete len:767 (-),score=183.41 c16093_g1_i2:111-2411(-)
MAEVEVCLPQNARANEMFEVVLPTGNMIHVICPANRAPGDRIKVRPIEVTLPQNHRARNFSATVHGHTFQFSAPRDTQAGSTFLVYVPTDFVRPPPPRSADPPATEQDWDIAGWKEYLSHLQQEIGPVPEHIRHAAEEIDVDQLPNEFLCAITCELMLDPVLTVDGWTYEREAIEKWFKKHRTSPKTNEPLPSTMLIPNRLLRLDIFEFLEAQMNDKVKPSVENDVSLDPDAEIPKFGEARLQVEAVHVLSSESLLATFPMTTEQDRIVAESTPLKLPTGERYKYRVVFKVLDGEACELQCIQAMRQASDAGNSTSRKTIVEMTMGTFATNKKKSYEWESEWLSVPAGPQAAGRYAAELKFVDLFGKQHLAARLALDLVPQEGVDQECELGLRELFIRTPNEGSDIVFDISTNDACAAMATNAFALASGVPHRLGLRFQVLSGVAVGLKLIVRNKKDTDRHVTSAHLDMGTYQTPHATQGDGVYEWISEELLITQGPGDYISALELRDREGCQYLACVQIFSVVAIPSAPSPAPPRASFPTQVNSRRLREEPTEEFDPEEALDDVAEIREQPERRASRRPPKLQRLSLGAFSSDAPGASALRGVGAVSDIIENSSVINREVGEVPESVGQMEIQTVFVDIEGQPRVTFNVMSDEECVRMADSCYTLKLGCTYRHGIKFVVSGGEVHGVNLVVRTMKTGTRGVASEYFDIGSYPPSPNPYVWLGPDLVVEDSEERLGHYVSAMAFSDSSRHTHLVCAQQHLIDTEWF